MLSTKKFITAKYLTISGYQSSYVIGSGSKQKIITSKPLFKDIVNIAHFCLESKTENEVINYLSSNNINFETLSYLIENKFLLNNSVDQSSRFSRNQIFFENIDINSELMQYTLSKLHVLIAGCGGIGNAMSYILATMGVKKITLIDGDTIEESNLNRQFLFEEKDVGCKKTSVLKNALISRNKSLFVDDIPLYVSHEAYLKISDKVDIVILSADNKQAIESTTFFTTKNRIPCLNVGYLCDYSIIGPFYIPGYSSCLMCAQEIHGEIVNLESDEISYKVQKINENMKAPSSPINNFFSASMASIDIIHYLDGKYDEINSLNKRVGISNKDYALKSIDFLRNEYCKACGYT